MNRHICNPIIHRQIRQQLFECATLVLIQLFKYTIIHEINDTVEPDNIDTLIVWIEAFILRERNDTVEPDNIYAWIVWIEAFIILHESSDIV